MLNYQTESPLSMFLPYIILFFIYIDMFIKFFVLLILQEKMPCVAVDLRGHGMLSDSLTGVEQHGQHLPDGGGEQQTQAGQIGLGCSNSNKSKKPPLTK